MTADVKHNIKDKEQTESVPLLCSKRWTLAYCGVFGFFFIYALRVNLSVGIVCMVNDTKKESANQTEDETCMSNTNVNATRHEGEFNWDKSQTSLMLSSFFYGYITTRVLGGWLSGRFGGKRVLGIGVGITAICNLLVPVAARWDYRSVLALRIIMGIAE
ncbi:sialin, partial [Biomphalaria pfeifferi]